MFITSLFICDAPATWDKSCCDSENEYPLIQPPTNLTDTDLSKVTFF